MQTKYGECSLIRDKKEDYAASEGRFVEIMTLSPSPCDIPYDDADSVPADIRFFYDNYNVIFLPEVWIISRFPGEPLQVHQDGAG